MEGVQKMGLTMRVGAGGNENLKQATLPRGDNNRIIYILNGILGS